MSRQENVTQGIFRRALWIVLIDTIIAILIVLWLIGIILTTIGWIIHLLLVLAVILLALRSVRGRHQRQ